MMWPFSVFTSKSASKHVQLANAVALPYCERLQKEKQLHLDGYGGGMMDCVNEYGMDFTTKKNYTLKKCVNY